MRSTKRLFVSIAAAVLATTLLPSSVGGTAAASGTPKRTSTTTTAPRCWEFQSTERAFYDKLNDARRSHGSGTLQLDKELSRAARKHSREMLDRDWLYHTPDGLLSDRVTHWNILGENVGVGGSVDSLHQAFMNSPAHKSNIVYSPFKNVGIGVKEGNGRIWVTVIFQASQDPGTTLWMPNC